jgi:hypothetical protein
MQDDPVQQAAPPSDAGLGPDVLRTGDEHAKMHQTPNRMSHAGIPGRQAVLNGVDARPRLNWRLAVAVAVNFVVWGLIGYAVLRLLGH